MPGAFLLVFGGLTVFRYEHVLASTGRFDPWELRVLTLLSWVMFAAALAALPLDMVFASPPALRRHEGEARLSRPVHLKAAR